MAGSITGCRLGTRQQAGTKKRGKKMNKLPRIFKMYDK